MAAELHLEKSSTDVLAFLVDFAARDLPTFRPGDWSNLSDDLRRTFHPTWTEIHIPRRAAVTVPTGEVEPGQVAALQREVRVVLERAVALKEHPDPLGEPPHADIRVSLSLLPAGAGVNVVVSGSWRDVVLEALFRALRDEAAARLRRCPECGTIFVRHRKQLYCTRRCVNRANKRAWLATPKGKRASQANRRRAYVHRQQQRLGRKVRVRLNSKRGKS